MKQINITIVSLLAFFLLATIGGCKEPAKSQGTQTTNKCIGEVTQQNKTPFVTTLSIADQAGVSTTTFTQGEPISFTVSWSNTSTTTQSAIAGNCWQYIDICDNDGLVFTTSTGVWPPDCFASLIPPTFTMSTGQSISSSVVWDQKDKNDRQVPVGKYCAVAEASGGEWITGSTYSTYTVLGRLPSSQLICFTIGP